MDQDARHRYYEELAVSHVLGGLNESDGQVFRSHLLECTSCRARVGELRRIAHDLADVERDERRTRAAKAVETKNRETEEEEAELEEPLPNPRSSRIVALVILLALVGLTSWNFLLQGRLARQQGNLEQAAVANDLLLDGVEARVVGTVMAPLTPGVTRVVADDVNALVVLDGVTRGEAYGIFQRNARGEILAGGSRFNPAVGARMTLVVPLERAAERIEVHRQRENRGRPPAGDQVPLLQVQLP